MAKKKPLKVIRVTRDIDIDLDESSLRSAIEELQAVADLDDCDPEKSTLYITYIDHYDEIRTYVTMNHDRFETEVEVKKRLEIAHKARETKKKNLEKKREEDMKLRDALLAKYPLV